MQVECSGMRLTTHRCCPHVVTNQVGMEEIAFRRKCTHICLVGKKILGTLSWYLSSDLLVTDKPNFMILTFTPHQPGGGGHETSTSINISVHPTEIRTSISPSSVVWLNTTGALANYATEAVLPNFIYLILAHFCVHGRTEGVHSIGSSQTFISGGSMDWPSRVCFQTLQASCPGAFPLIFCILVLIFTTHISAYRFFQHLHIRHHRLPFSAVIDSLVYCEINALGHVATEVGLTLSVCTASFCHNDLRPRRVLLAVCTLLVVLLGLAHSARLPREDRYTTKYDNINLKEILESDRLRKSYLDCLLNDKAPCTPDAKLLKESIPDALTNKCSKCSDKQKEGTKEVTAMLLTLSVFCFMCVTQSLSGIPREDKYTKRWDSIDLDQILHTDRLLEGYLRCLMEEGPCTPDARDLKSIVPDALETNCTKCSEKQKEGSEKVIDYLIENKPDRWHQLERKYDPEGKYLELRGEKNKREDVVQAVPTSSD
uniref:Uncharacterized protein n=1 Tax=Timema tahoe TaxID=61484 RepID=A0A7R9IGZ9_9NEOP|nr:unnamed protein product [Timema tahoe]